MVFLAASMRRMMKRTAIVLGMLGLGGTLMVHPQALAQTPSQSGASRAGKVIVDTDIGDDIDDAFALALALRSPEIEVIGITTAWGDTALRARLANRLLREEGAGAIPVLAGVLTPSKSNFTQADWAREAKQRRLIPMLWNFCWNKRRRLPER
jgi:hypothetical protein